MESFTVGTGASIYTQHLVPAILSAQQEIILVTCYWAASKSLTALCDTLDALARQRKSQDNVSILRIRICFSSRSFFQKLFHTSSPDGYTYPPSTWHTKLGLPPAEILAAGKIDLRVKSLFFLPFSVMHPKFLLVDRRRAFLPSCNVSWEAWLEGCLELARREPRNDLIDRLLDFYQTVWEKDLPAWDVTPTQTQQPEVAAAMSIVKSPADTSIQLNTIAIPSEAIQWLPSWHHRNPAFSLLPWKTPKAPPTPLNQTLMRLFTDATREIYLQTPNITSPPVLDALLDALARGVDVNIVTSRNMMVWEQILTAGTTSERCIASLIQRYSLNSSSSCTPPDGDVEAQHRFGALKISYFRPRRRCVAEDDDDNEEPVHSHLKLSVFDGECTVLGSGNMDRASWFTSQELGILVRSSDFAGAILSTSRLALEGRLDVGFPPPT